MHAKKGYAKRGHKGTHAHTTWRHALAPKGHHNIIYYDISNYVCWSHKNNFEKYNCILSLHIFYNDIAKTVCVLINQTSLKTLFHITKTGYVQWHHKNRVCSKVYNLNLFKILNRTRYVVRLSSNFIPKKLGSHKALLFSQRAFVVFSKYRLVKRPMYIDIYMPNGAHKPSDQIRALHITRANNSKCEKE